MLHREFPDDPLRCRSVVENFVSCAKKAQQVRVFPRGAPSVLFSFPTARRMPPLFSPASIDVQDSPALAHANLNWLICFRVQRAVASAGGGLG